MDGTLQFASERASNDRAPHRLRAGVVGCGLIAQVMHLPHLRELDDRYELVAACDVSASVVEACGRRYGLSETYGDYRSMLAEASLDVIFDLTPGSHAPVAIAAAEAGCHVFVEKPVCLMMEEGQEVFEAVRRAGIRLMVGTHKRYDPAYERLLELLPGTEVRLAQATTLEAPTQPYVSQRSMVRAEAQSNPSVAAAVEEERRRLEGLLGTTDPEACHGYRYTLLGTLIHEFNMLRGALGEPDLVRSARVRRDVVQLGLSFGEIECHLSWVNGSCGPYRQRLSFFGEQQRVALTLPSPYLREAPSEVEIEFADPPQSSHFRRTVESVSFEEAFKRELIEFAVAIAEDREPRTNLLDGLHDLALCRAVIESDQRGEEVAEPSRLPDWAGSGDETVHSRTKEMTGR